MTRAADLAKLIAGSSTLGGTGELVLKDIDTADGSSPKITFQTGDTDIASADVLGTIDFQAPDEGTGTDALLVAAGIEAVSEGDFSSSSNATSLVLKTGASEAAAEKVRLTSAGRLGIGTNSPSYQLQVNGSTDILNVKGATGNAFVRFTDSDSSADFSIGADDGSSAGAGSFILYDRSNSAYRLLVDANGHVTMPSQPAFFAHVDTQQSNLSANSETQITLGTERFDQNGDFASNTFTAPVTGKYQLNMNIRLNNLDSAAAYYIIYLNTSNKKYFSIMDPTQYNGDIDYFTFNESVLADMDANDTATIGYLQSGGSAQTDVDGGASDSPSNFSGYLVA